MQAVPTGISSQQYDAILTRADCLLLPYSGPRYRLSGSGIVYEALARGIPFICSAGLAFSDYAHGGMIEVDSDAAFAKAMRRFAADPHPFRAAATAAAQRYLDAQRSGAFLTRVRSAPGIIGAEACVVFAQLVERANQRLGDKHASIGAEVAAGVR